MSLDPLSLDDDRHALAADAADPLHALRGQFHIPRHGNADMAYFVGNSLGLQPRAAAGLIAEELESWATQAVEGHFRGARPWMDYHSQVRDGLAEVVGAQPLEVVAMNSLTTNLHLLMASFYRPSAERPAILIEAGAFPSDRHAVASQIRFHGFDPERDLIELAADEPGEAISLAAIERALAEHGRRIALVLWPGVQYRTGQAFDLKEISRLAHAQGCVAGFDLAHAAGNLHLALHDSDADFAVWCHYKYMNAGPGAVAGAFVHERHARADLPRLAGWWGHDPATRFQMGPEFTPTPGADGWQLSNPPILGLTPLIASLDLFQRAGMAALRAKSERLTGYLEALIRRHLDDLLDILTPAEPSRRGCQLSLRVRAGREAGRALFRHLSEAGVLGDWREPDVIRIAPAPLYNRHGDVLRFARACRDFARNAG
ncbi:MAG: kynureninase [Lysobacteraceae bacterium]